MLTSDLAFAVQSDQAKHSSWGWQNDRRVFWQSVADRFQTEMAEGRVKISDVELAKLRRLGKGVIWMEMVTNEHRSIYEAIYKELQGKEMPASSRIEKDVPRTFGIFNTDWMGRMRHKLEKRQRYGALNRLLNAMSSMTGYSQGMNFLAAVLMLEVPETDAFCLLSVVLRQRCLGTVFENDSSGLLDYMNLFEDLLKEYVPRVWQHFQEHQFNSIMYAIEWFTTLFAVSGRLNLVLCIFDLFICGFKDILLRVGLACCKVLEKDLLALNEEELQLNFKKMVKRLMPEEVIPLALTAQLSLGEKDILQQLQDRMDVAGPITEMSPQDEERWREEIRHKILHKLGTEVQSDDSDSDSSRSSRSRASTVSSLSNPSSNNVSVEEHKDVVGELSSILHSPEDEEGGEMRKDALKTWLEMRIDSENFRSYVSSRLVSENSMRSVTSGDEGSSLSVNEENVQKFQMPPIRKDWFGSSKSRQTSDQRLSGSVTPTYDADAEHTDSETDFQESIGLRASRDSSARASFLLENALEHSRPMDSSEEGKFLPSWPINSEATLFNQAACSDSESETEEGDSSSFKPGPTLTQPINIIKGEDLGNTGPNTPDDQDQRPKMELLHMSFQNQLHINRKEERIKEYQGSPPCPEVAENNCTPTEENTDVGKATEDTQSQGAENQEHQKNSEQRPNKTGIPHLLNREVKLAENDINQVFTQQQASVGNEESVASKTEEVMAPSMAAPPAALAI